MTLFARKGIHQTNSKEIAAEAGVSIGSFYSYFADKKNLLIDVLGNYLDMHFNAIWANEPSMDLKKSPSKIIRYYIENLLEAYDIAPDFHKETHVLRYSDPAVKALYDRETEKELKQIIWFLDQFKEEIHLNDREAAAVVLHSAAENLAHKIKFMKTIDHTRLVSEFTDMIHRYLVKG